MYHMILSWSSKTTTWFSRDFGPEVPLKRQYYSFTFSTKCDVRKAVRTSNAVWISTCLQLNHSTITPGMCFQNN
jgi:hypothetical protein